MTTPAEAREVLLREGLRPPATLTLAITGACNLACRHCWVGAGTAAAAGHVPGQTLHRLMREFADLGGEGIRITGGEPLSHPGWQELLRLARTLGFRAITLQTNAMLLRHDHVATLAEVDFPGLSIQVSLDGVRASTHDLVRGAGAFEGTVAGIQLLVEAGFGRRLTILFTEMRHNLAEFPELLAFAADRGIAAVVSGTLVRGGRAAEGGEIAPPDPRQYEQLFRRYDTEAGFRKLYGDRGTMAALEWRANTSDRTECCTFAENPYLTPDGLLYPCLLCHADEYAVTGVFDKGLAAALAEGAPLWSSLLQVSRSRGESLAECRECPGRSACAGGCMGRAQGSCGDLMAADDRCGVRRSIYCRK
ncbi:MAG TPA: radical SAM protein [Geobacteraceae bacterium]